MVVVPMVLSSLLILLLTAPPPPAPLRVETALTQLALVRPALFSDIRRPDEIDDLLAAIDLSTTQALEGKSLQTLILSLPPPEAKG